MIHHTGININIQYTFSYMRLYVGTLLYHIFLICGGFLCYKYNLYNFGRRKFAIRLYSGPTYLNLFYNIKIHLTIVHFFS